jgi:amino acid transporter
VTGFFLMFVTVSLAELASAAPSSAGGMFSLALWPSAGGDTNLTIRTVYQWATMAAGKRIGPLNGYFAGWMNYFSWQTAGCGLPIIIGKAILQAYTLYHPGFVASDWQVFIIVVVIAWTNCAVLLFANRHVSIINMVFFVVVFLGWIISFITLAVMAGTGGRKHATSSFVWKEWLNETGYTSNGLVFLTGMLNGAFAMSTPDAVSHLSEEVARYDFSL